MKNIFFVFVLTILYSIPCLASNIYTVTKDNINIRADSTTSAQLLGSLSRNEKVVVIKKRFDWAKIILPKNFYCYLAEQFAEPSKKKKIKVSASGVNLRNLPSLKSAIIGQCPRGTILPFIKTVDGWVKIKGHPYISGWVNQKFLKEDTENFLSLINQLTSDYEIYSAKEKQNIHRKLISGGSEIVPTLENHLKDIDNDAAYSVIIILTEIAKNDSELIPHFIKKINTDKPKIAGIYLDAIQNVLYPRYKKTAYFYQAENNNLSKEAILKAKKMFKSAYLRTKKITGKNAKTKNIQVNNQTK